MTLIFGDMLHKQVEDYVDDLVDDVDDIVLRIPCSLEWD